RREGIDVSVPSNTVPFEVAERIRTKYYPKKVAPVHGPRLVKTVKPVIVEPTVEEVVETESAVEAEAPPQEAGVAAAEAKPGPPRPKILKLSKQVQAPAPGGGTRRDRGCRERG